MHINISCEATCWSQPIGTTTEFWGWRGATLFTVIRPIGETGECGAPSLLWDKNDLQVFMGKVEKPKDSEHPEGRKDIKLGLGQSIKISMEPVKVLEVKKCKQTPPEKFPHDRTLIVETAQGPLYLPDLDVRKGDIPTFNGQPVKYL